MEKVLHNSPLLEIPTDIVDDKYVSGLSTILVTTIQETKDRISQIEYIFCSQLFPSFQSNSKSLQKIYHEAKKAAEDEWKENEKALLLQIKKLQSEKQQTLEENQSLKLENAKYIEFGGLKRMIHLEDDLRQKTREVDKARELQQSLLELLESKASIILDNEKLVKELENEKSLLLKKQRSLELEAEGLRLELTRKSKEVDGGMELQNKLLQLIQSKTSLIVHKEKQMKEREEKTNGTIAKIKNLEEKVGKLQEEVDKKNQEVETGKNLQQELLRRIESQTSKIVTYEEMSKNLRRKIEEVEEGRKMREEMHKQIELKNSEILKIEQEVEELRKERELNMGKLKHLEGKVDKLLADLKERNNDSVEGMELHGKLLQQIEAKDLELLSEKNKRRDVIAAYKRLKSQYTYLCAKFGLTTEDMIPWGTKEDESDPLRREQILLSSPDTENMVPCEMTKQKDETPKSKDQIGFRLIQKSSLDSPSHSQTPIPYPKCSTTSKSGSKRPVSSWRDTRSHQKRAGLDPHDDFLDTPLDNIVGNSKKITKEVHDLADPVPKDMVFDTSDDETQDMNIDPGPEKQPMQAPRPGLRGYKYVEPVRKKADRENLKGVECKQCKKFYDAVLVNGGDKQQCEHHNGVSRHRYRYAPPLTPEGFWNIGFESEM